MKMRYLSVCSGIEAASAAWRPLGWEAVAYSEIDKFPSAVLAHHYPDVPNLGDMTKFKDWPDAACDVLVGGTPCQSFSIAGLRKGLDDPRGNLTLVYLALADRFRPRWVVWENVPGVLSDNGGRTFGTFLGGLAKLGYGFAYRILDAQYFGLAQRRKRVFVVGYLGDWRRAAAVLLEREGLRGDSAPRRQTRENVAPTISARPTGGGGLGTDFDLDGGLIAGTVDASASRSRGAGTNPGMIAHALRAEGFDASEDGTGRGVPLTVGTLTSNGDNHSGFKDEHGLVAFNITPSNSNKDYNARQATHAQAVTTQSGSAPSARGGDVVTYAIQERAVSENIENGPQGKGYQEGHAYTIEARNKVQAVATTAVRRLTPRECERLQGFPDDFTLIPYRNGMSADGPRYKALGNSMAVPVMSWIGKRILQAELNHEFHTPGGA